MLHAAGKLESAAPRANALSTSQAGSRNSRQDAALRIHIMAILQPFGDLAVGVRSRRFCCCWDCPSRIGCVSRGAEVFIEAGVALPIVLPRRCWALCAGRSGTAQPAGAWSDFSHGTHRWHYVAELSRSILYSLPFARQPFAVSFAGVTVC